MKHYLGIDFGTSGARACVIDQQGKQLATAVTHLSPDELLQPQNWTAALRQLFDLLSTDLSLGQVSRIAVDGTSGTVLLCNPSGTPVSDTLPYHDQQSVAQAKWLRQHSPYPQHITLSASSTLARALRLIQQTQADAFVITHQADYLLQALCGEAGVTDYHNALKLGFDVENLCWPEWIEQLLPADCLPRVDAPGTPVARLLPDWCTQYDLPEECVVCSGSTDSNAAFLATGVNSLHTAVTSLGTTLVLKTLSDHPVSAPRFGVYSHRLGKYWLTGGASNAGAGVLRRFFSDQQLAELSKQINPRQTPEQVYRPLLKTGERFPVNDPELEPLLEPRCDDDAQFLHDLLHAIALIEKQGYQLFQQLGCEYPTSVISCGGGAVNENWRAMRSWLLNVPVTVAEHSEASYGSALLARDGLAAFA